MDGVVCYPLHTATRQETNRWFHVHLNKYAGLEEGGKEMSLETPIEDQQVKTHCFKNKSSQIWKKQKWRLGMWVTWLKGSFCLVNPFFLEGSLPAGRPFFILHARNTVNSMLRRSIVLIWDWIARYSVWDQHTQALGACAHTNNTLTHWRQ